MAKDKPLLTVSEVSTYARIARDALTRMNEWLEQGVEPDWSAIDLLSESGLRAGKQWVDANAAAHREAYTAIIFAATSLEALINHIGMANISGAYWKDYVDRVDVVVKWVIVPKICDLPKSLDRGGQAFEGLRALVKSRNALIHPKPRFIKDHEQLMSIDPEELRPYDTAVRAVNTLTLVADELGSPYGDELR